MKVAITGHTRGIGKEIAEYFSKLDYEVVGFSASTGYNIQDPEIRKKIISEAEDCDIFVNNAMVLVDNSQTLMLKEIYSSWSGKRKLIINVSSISGDYIWWLQSSPHPEYTSIKHEQDVFCATRQGSPFILNLKPGMVATDLTEGLAYPKMDVSVISTILDIFRNNKDAFMIKSITFVPNVAK